MRDGSAYTYATSFPSLRACAEYEWRQEIPEDPIELRPFNVPDAVQTWLDTEFAKEVGECRGKNPM